MNKRIRKKKAKQLDEFATLRAKEFIALCNARVKAEVLMHKIFRVHDRKFFQGCVSLTHQSLKEHERIVPAITNESVLSCDQQAELLNVVWIDPEKSDLFETINKRMSLEKRNELLNGKWEARDES